MVGAGFVGIEMAEAFRERGMAVTVLDATEGPMTMLDPDMSMLLAEQMVAEGITCSFNQRVRAIDGRRPRCSGGHRDRQIPGRCGGDGRGDTTEH